MDVTERGGSSGLVFGQQRVAESPLKTSPVRNGEDFQGDPDGIWKGHGGGDFSFLQKGVESKGEGGCRDIFDSGEEERGKRGERGRTNDKKGSLVAQPRLIMADTGNGKNEVAQPVGQTQKVGLVGRGGGGNHKVTSG